MILTPDLFLILLLILLVVYTFRSAIKNILSKVTNLFVKGFGDFKLNFDTTNTATSIEIDNNPIRNIKNDISGLGLEYDKSICLYI